MFFVFSKNMINVNILGIWVKSYRNIIFIQVWNYVKKKKKMSLDRMTI